MRGSGSGASRTRTGDLLGAIQGAQHPNVTLLQGDVGRSWQTGEPKIARNLREFTRVLARGGVRVAKPPTAIEAEKAGGEEARILAGHNDDRLFRSPAQSGSSEDVRAATRTAPAQTFASEAVPLLATRCSGRVRELVRDVAEGCQPTVVVDSPAATEAHDDGVRVRGDVDVLPVIHQRVITPRPLGIHPPEVSVEVVPLGARVGGGGIPYPRPRDHAPALPPAAVEEQPTEASVVGGPGVEAALQF